MIFHEIEVFGICTFWRIEMTGIPGRSGRPAATNNTSEPDGVPESPRSLSPTAQMNFAWLAERLGTATQGSPWRRIDGACLATLSELLESEQQLAAALLSDPVNAALLRLRIQYADRIYKYSGLVGMTPRDRSRVPQNSKSDGDDAFDTWLKSAGASK